MKGINMRLAATTVHLAKSAMLDLLSLKLSQKYGRRQHPIVSTHGPRCEPKTKCNSSLVQRMISRYNHNTCIAINHMDGANTVLTLTLHHDEVLSRHTTPHHHTMSCSIIDDDTTTKLSIHPCIRMFRLLEPTILNPFMSTIMFIA